MSITYETLKKLKSGTDIRGVALEVPGGRAVTLTDSAVRAIIAGFALWLGKRTGKERGLKIAVGRDSRISGPRIRDAALNELAARGVSALDCGLASTPAMFMTTVDLDCDGAVQITASHHPYDRNGLKFFTREGGLEGSDIDEVLKTAVSAGEGRGGGEIAAADYMPVYCARLRDMICREVNASDYNRPLKGFHIVVDAGNGVGGFYAGDVLEPLGADVSGSQFLEPDGLFPNHVPNPEDKDAMASVCKAVTAAGADLGVIFDTDVDRAGCVDSGGRELGRNRLVALASAIALEGNAGGTVVTDSITSDGLKAFIEGTLGGRHCRYKRGYRNVIGEAVRLNAEGINCPLAIETSGHAAMRENYFLDDGAYLATKIIIRAARLRGEGKPLESMIQALAEPAESIELRFNITVPDFREYGERLLKDLEAYAHAEGWAVAEDSREGVRISFGAEDGGGWLLLRLSVHDPVMPLNAESNRAGGCGVILSRLARYFEEREIKDSGASSGLDITALTQALSRDGRG